MAEPQLQEILADHRRRATLDLAIVLAVFVACYISEPGLDPMLRRGHGLISVLALAAYQFTFEGAAVVLVMLFRREHFSDYGFTRHNLGKSVFLALTFAAIYDLALSLHAGAFLWIPLRRQPAIRMSLEAGFPLSLVGLSMTIAVWGFFEAFFGVFFAKKLNQIFPGGGQGWFSIGVLGFALFNGLIHLTVHQGLEGFITSFASGYAIAVIPSMTRNAWGSAVVQALTNAVGKR
jgi:hypothetical protein